MIASRHTICENCALQFPQFCAGRETTELVAASDDSCDVFWVNSLSAKLMPSSGVAEL